ncbi:calcium-dependent/calmodulin-independent protein kinase [Artemisia annua]|uniref:Calcium-dependent/calmodulin-independent protein kinase n=1 Tax=Artemisia annua TaxID=35608 RepID=A0A2U1M896_ARTAN|nr:calcium-dependent/calmodulin-independent protein kinase [Artemisia annua]
MGDNLDLGCQGSKWSGGVACTHPQLNIFDNRRLEPGPWKKGPTVEAKPLISIIDVMLQRFLCYNCRGVCLQLIKRLFVNIPNRAQAETVQDFGTGVLLGCDSDYPLFGFPQDMFKAMDTDNSGAITFDELKAGLRKFGSTLKDTEIRDLGDDADVDNSGTIDYAEFVATTIHLNKLDLEEHLVAAFQYFDKDGSGYITVDEL